MAATVTTVGRAAETADDPIKCFNDGSSRRVQAFTLDPEVTASVLSWDVTAGTGENQAVAKASAGQVVIAEVVTAAGLTGNHWLMIFDKATAPVNTDVPVMRARVDAGWASIDMAPYGRNLTTGIAVALSTTVDTLTLAGANDAFFQVGYL